ncbi:hypothetical protein RJ639_013179 [Escallonia herrerae]|uniref:Amino acid transporter transmembrane domain-containing protein n=1 Tax=Escallonia herrerae TaxID=1293975 RepID=A0AA88VGY1_9ASTE|nr:hypothetical protein RJ639_013179 [Escallonia herrerae]
MQGNYACNVETPKIQVQLLHSHHLYLHTKPTIRVRHLLDVRRKLLNHSNAFALLPKTCWRNAAVILMLIHQVIDYCSTVSSPALSLLILVPVNCAVFVFLTEIEWRNVVLVAQFITFGFACTPLYFVGEKVIGMHDTRSICLRALARLPVVIPIWFLAIIFPFFGPINAAVGAFLVTFTVYIIPSLAHMLTYRKASARQIITILKRGIKYSRRDFFRATIPN